MKIVLSILILGLILLPIAAEAGQKQIGTTCKSDASAFDWDTPAQCNGSTFVRGPIQLGSIAAPPYSATTCDATKAGMIQFSASNGFQGCNGATWGTFSSNTSGIIQAKQSSTGGVFVTASTSYVAIPACQLSLTTTGGGVMLHARVDIQSDSGTSWGYLSLFRDGANLDVTYGKMAHYVGNEGYNLMIPLDWIDTPSSGSHLYQIYVKSETGAPARVNEAIPCLIQAVEFRAAN